MGGHAARLFVCSRVSWSRSAIIYMAVNSTSTGACFVLVILRITLKLIELRLICNVVKSPRLSAFDDFPNKFVDENWALSVHSLVTGRTPYGLWRPQFALSSSHRTCTCDTIRVMGFYA